MLSGVSNFMKLRILTYTVTPFFLVKLEAFLTSWEVWLNPAAETVELVQYKILSYPSLKYNFNARTRGHQTARNLLKECVDQNGEQAERQSKIRPWILYLLSTQQRNLIFTPQKWGAMNMLHKFY